ncbi:GNAT family N-acetyltransferase [Microvirga sp. M2]|uniref:GNAT family N-acetyltransferase n=1 Tax=Microvirga sp. M2 TaxID=3073270 RepID=UPI0039C0C243
MNDSTPIILHTDRFELRTMNRSDPPEAFMRWAMDPEIMAPMNLPPRALSSAQVADYWGGFDNINRYFLGIIERSSQNQVGFWMVEANLLHKTATWHLAIDRSKWGEDVSVETGIPLLDWLFGERDIDKVISLTLATNDKVIHRMKMGGWHLEGVLRAELRSLTGGGRLDQLRFSLLREEWPDARANLIAAWKRSAI